MVDLALWFENDELLQKAKEKHEAEEAARGRPKKPSRSRCSAKARASSSSSSSSSASTGSSAPAPPDPEAETSASEETQKRTYGAALRQPNLAEGRAAKLSRWGSTQQAGRTKDKCILFRTYSTMVSSSGSRLSQPPSRH